MKSKFISISLGLLPLTLSLLAFESAPRHYGVKEFPHQEIFKKEFSIKSDEGAILFLGNVSGGIEIEGYEGDKIILELIKNINSNSRESTLKGVEEIQFKTIQEGNSVWIFMGSPYASFDRTTSSYTYKNNCGDKSCYDYSFQLNYKIKVPKNIDLKIQNVDKGSISINNVNSSKIVVSNVVGSIVLNKVLGAIEAKTVEGNVEIDLEGTPPAHCNFVTVNGNINAILPKEINAGIRYEIRKGKFKNDFIKSKNVKEVTNFVKGRLDIGNSRVLLNFNLISGNIEINSK